MRAMNWWSVPLVLCAFALVAPGEGWAQQKQKVAFKVDAGNTKYPQRHVIDVGDEPGHQITLYEIHRVFGAEAPTINGVKAKETWTRGQGDYMNNNGLSVNHTIYVMENGDRFYVLSRTMGHADAAGKRKTVSVGEIRGGTGKFAGMKGMARAQGASDGKAGFNETNAEIEYWFEK